MHTPGPWDREGTTVYKLNGVSVEGAPNGWNLFTVRISCSDTKRCPPDEVLANARLIAAAPDILATLEEIVRYVSPGDDQVFASMLEDAKAAIRKANGQ
jgi:hypothetical protein